MIENVNGIGWIERRETATAPWGPPILQVWVTGLGVWRDASLKEAIAITNQIATAQAETAKLRRALSQVREAWETVDGCPGKTICEIVDEALGPQK